MNHLVGVMLSPGKTFDAIRSKTSWSVPLIVLLILSVVTVWLQMPVIQKLALQALKDAGQPEAAVGMTLTITTVSSYIGGVVGTAALVFIAAFLLLLVNMMIKGEASYMQLARVSLFSYFPAAIGALLTGILMRLNDAQTLQDVTLSAAVFLTEKKGLLFNIAQAVNPFSIWSLVLMVVGTAVVTMRSKAAVAAWVVPGWLLFSVLSGFLQK